MFKLAFHSVKNYVRIKIHEKNFKYYSKYFNFLPLMEIMLLILLHA